jgi:hypothetical protein
MIDILPDDIITIIANFVITSNKYFTTKEINNNNYDNSKMYIVFKKDKFKSVLNKNREILNLLKKYYVYQYGYDLCLDPRGNHPNYIIKNKNQSSPILIDALFTGCYLPFAKHSAQPNKEYFETELFPDIQKMIKLMPSCIHSTWGQMRCRNKVTPLYAAMINKNIPLYIIEYLLQNGADKNMYILVDNKKCHVLDDYYSCGILNGERNFGENYRYTKLKSLLDKYK